MDDLTIEHLVPQSWIGSDGWDAAIVGSLGNLVLVPKELNSRLENKPYKEKKEILLKGGYERMLPADFWSVDALTPVLISGRTQELASQGYQKVWKI